MVTYRPCWNSDKYYHSLDSHLCSLDCDSDCRSCRFRSWLPCSFRHCCYLTSDFCDMWTVPRGEFGMEWVSYLIGNYNFTRDGVSCEVGMGRIGNESTCFIKLLGSFLRLTAVGRRYLTPLLAQRRNPCHRTSQNCIHHKPWSSLSDSTSFSAENRSRTRCFNNAFPSAKAEFIPRSLLPTWSRIGRSSIAIVMVGRAVRVAVVIAAFIV